MGQNNRIRRQRLYEEDPYCHWCGVHTVEGGSGNNRATLDHIKSRLVRRSGEYSEVVIACYRCNNARAAEEHAKLPYWERVKRSGPGGYPILGLS